MSADEHESETEFPRAASWHPASYAERPRFVGSGKDDAAPNHDRFAAQARVEELFDRRIEGIEVGVENRGCRHHTHHRADASRV